MLRTVSPSSLVRTGSSVQFTSAAPSKILVKSAFIASSHAFRESAIAAKSGRTRHEPTRVDWGKSGERIHRAFSMVRRIPRRADRADAELGAPVAAGAAQARGEIDQDGIAAVLIGQADEVERGPAPAAAAGGGDFLAARDQLADGRWAGHGAIITQKGRPLPSGPLAFPDTHSRSPAGRASGLFATARGP
jgi:hypothetical protein